jgi:hypothetical protein
VVRKINQSKIKIDYLQKINDQKARSPEKTPHWGKKVRDGQ